MSENTELVDHETFAQLLDMDDDDTHDFTNSLLTDYFEQMYIKVEELDALVKANKLDEVSQLGHFLKGSSASIGAERARNICDDIQHYSLNVPDNEAISYLQKKVDALRISIPVTKVALYAKLS